MGYSLLQRGGYLNDIPLAVESSSNVLFIF